MTSTASDLVERQIHNLAQASLPFVALHQFADRLEDLRMLVAAHHKVGGTGPGKREERIAALNRAAAVLLASQFQGFVLDLFSEAWRLKYGSNPSQILDRIRINNALPKEDIDPLFSFLGIDGITSKAEFRPTASGVMPPSKNAAPTFVRAGERAKHQTRAVVAELTRVRNHIAHGGRGVPIRLSDVVGYLADCVHLAVGLGTALKDNGIRP